MRRAPSTIALLGVLVMALALARPTVLGNTGSSTASAPSPTTIRTGTVSRTATTVTNTTNPFSDVEIDPQLPSTCAIPMIAHYQNHVAPLGDCAGLIGNLHAAVLSVPVGSVIGINGTWDGQYFGSDASGPFYGPFVSSQPGIAEVLSQTPSEVVVVARAVGSARLAAGTQFTCVDGSSSDCTGALISVTP